MKRLFIIMMLMAIMLSGCIDAYYKKMINPDVTEFRFRMVNEADIDHLDITAPGWHVVASKMSNKTAIDQGIIAESVIRAVTGIP